MINCQGCQGPFLADLLPSIGACLGISPYDTDVIGLPGSTRYVVVLVDGLGWDITMRALIDAPYIASVIGDARRIQVSTPSTTSSSLTSLWTGVSSGSHGIVGFSFELDGQVEVPLLAKDPIPTAQPIMNRMSDAGVDVTWVIPREHIESGLTRMGTRTAHMVGVDTPDHDRRVAEISSAARRGSHCLVFVYEPRLDEAGHAYGVASAQWREALTSIDSFLEQLRTGLDDDVVLLVTGDHGMVDVTPDDRIDIGENPDLNADLRLIAGEARFRHLYTHSPHAVAQRWKDHLGDQALVMTRSQAVDSGLFGLVDPRYLPRIGDVVATPTFGQAYLTSAFPGEYHLIGMHGGRTSAELYVPVLID